MIHLVVAVVLVASGGLEPVDAADQVDLAYLRYALTAYAPSCAGRRHHEPDGVMSDVHAEHLRMVRSSWQRVHDRRR